MITSLPARTLCRKANVRRAPQFPRAASPALLLFCGTLCLWLTAAAGFAAPAHTWDFEHGLSGWQKPGEAAVAVDPDAPANHACQITATRPHHTQLILTGSEATPNFTASFRYKLLSWEGAPPVVYAYARLEQNGFRAVSIQGGSARGFAYFGQTQPSVPLGSAKIPPRQAEKAWVRIRIAAYDDYLFAKVWPEGAPEPGWQITGEAGGQPQGRFAVGVWTSPRTPSTARVLFDDITFQPLGPADLQALQVRVSPRAPLDPAAVPAPGGIFETPEMAGIATASTAVAFDRRTGELAHVVDRPSRQEFVAPRVYRPLFQATLTKPEAGQESEISAADFRTLQINRAGGSLELRFFNHPTLPLTARVTAVAGNDGLVHLRISVTNQSDWAVSAIRFPQMASPAALGKEAADDNLLLPWADGALLTAPGERSQSRDALYPEHAFTQFSALYDKTAGLYVAAYDPDGHCKRWELRVGKDQSVEMPLAHLFPEVPGQAVTLPYDVVLGTFTGDWREAAALYKRWAKQQPWCRRRLTERADIPRFLKEGAGVIIAGIQNGAGYNDLLGKDLERLPDLVQRYRERTGLSHLIFVPYGWENRGTWAGINYLPAVPTNEDWQRANAALRAQGDRTAFLTSGYWWVVKRRQTGNGPAFDDAADYARRQEMTIHNADGKVWTLDNYKLVGPQGDWRGLSVKLCHGSPQARDALRAAFLEVARLGTPLISFDQEIGGGQHVPCYSKTHGHPPGYGNWIWTDFRNLCARILKEGKPIQPELGLFMENCSELAIPYMATYWSRQFGEVDHGATGARGIGLFSYLYHEYVTAIGAACVQGQGLLGTRAAPGLRCYVLANNLTRGLIPGPFLQDVPLEPKSEWEKAVSQAYFSYSQPYARFPEYLMLGSTCRPPQVTCRDAALWFYRADPNGEPLKPGGPRVAKVPLSLPAVTAGSFTAADGSTGTILVNTTGEIQQASVRLNAAARSAVLYRANRGEEQRWEAAADQEIALTLEPYGTRMLVTR